uniref:FHA domain-containing protein n=2 Tax=Lactuca sativa TaxID=4236 RepID=A0A9R1WZH4_LACSA|nr:hypothetical protein LSAT_V11C800393930 [Lactuca sativa]
MELHVGDVLRFGHSTRLYIFQGPTDLMPLEKDMQSVKNLKIRQENRNMEATLLHAKREAPLADGISWGMDEDVVEENKVSSFFLFFLIENRSIDFLCLV